MAAVVLVRELQAKAGGGQGADDIADAVPPFDRHSRSGRRAGVVMASGCVLDDGVTPEAVVFDGAAVFGQDVGEGMELGQVEKASWRDEYGCPGPPGNVRKPAQRGDGMLSIERNRSEGAGGTRRPADEGEASRAGFETSAPPTVAPRGLPVPPRSGAGTLADPRASPRSVQKRSGTTVGNFG